MPYKPSVHEDPWDRLWTCVSCWTSGRDGDTDTHPHPESLLEIGLITQYDDGFCRLVASIWNALELGNDIPYHAPMDPTVAGLVGLAIEAAAPPDEYLGATAPTLREFLRRRATAQWAIAEGTATAGFRFTGPFRSLRDAVSAMRSGLGERQTIVAIEAPSLDL